MQLNVFFFPAMMGSLLQKLQQDLKQVPVANTLTVTALHPSSDTNQGQLLSLGFQPSSY